MGAKMDVWDKWTPVEKSSYLRDQDITYFNLDHFELDPEKLTMLDLFCGAGGFAVGCSWAGFQSVYGVDHFAPAMETWCENHPHAIGCLGDITKIDPKSVKALLQSKGVEHINLITAGVPCQGFSIANRKHNDRDQRNYLFHEYMKFVQVFEPDYIILENVSGMQSTGGGRFVKNIKAAMNRLGYTVKVQMLNAADFGVPQIRQRLLFVGVRRGAHLADSFTFPKGSFRHHYRTVSDAISDLPALGSSEASTKYAAPPKNDYQRLMRGTGAIASIPEPTLLENHVAPHHPPETIQKIASTKPGKPMYAKFKQRIRLNAGAPSPTQLAGGIRPQFQFGHPTQPRGLTIRERARIQSFPDSYRFRGGMVQERVQTGNAVPPLLVYHIARPIAEDIQRRDQQKMYRVWYSTESFADYIIDHTSLHTFPHRKQKLFESDANHPNGFYTMPDHIRKILYLDAPDIIVEKNNEPIFSIEISTEAGTGHNVFQRFARIAASVENKVPVFYIYPEGKIVRRKNKSVNHKWDMINPLVFRALEYIMRLYEIPALLYYFPTDEIKKYTADPSVAPHFQDKGLCYDADLARYPGCPDATADSMVKMFDAINVIIDTTESPSRSSPLHHQTIQEHRDFMQEQFVLKAQGKTEKRMSPLSAVTVVPTQYLLNYLSQYETNGYALGELLRSRADTVLYQINADFRDDPYAGCLTAIDYLKCRNGPTFEDRSKNLVMVWGKLSVDDLHQTLQITDKKGSTITGFFDAVKSCAGKNLLTKDYADLKNHEIPRYLMQVRYGSTYSKVKHIRVISYFADAVLFPDGSLWRDA